MAKLQKQTKQNPKLEQRELKDGRIALYLEYYLGRSEEVVKDADGKVVYYTEGAMKDKPKKKVTHLRKKESLPFYLIAKPTSPMERQQNREILEMAEKIRFEKEQELKEQQTGLRLAKHPEEINFFDYFQSFIDNYTKKDVRHMRRGLAIFKEFLKEKKKYKAFVETIRPDQITKEMIREFAEYLQSRFNGEGPHTLFQRFKKVFKKATEDEIFQRNPCEGVVIRIDSEQLKKDILSMDEIKQLALTHYPNENPDIRRAFLFCLFAGLRFCDVKDLTFAQVDFSNRLLRFNQVKTAGHSSASWVNMPLSDTHLKLMGEPENGDKNQLIFPLPSHTMCLKALRHWTTRAGIEKHITWHCARHSFAVNLLNNGANIKTVASLLGHAGLKHTEKYTRAVDSLKREAIDSLPEISF